MSLSLIEKALNQEANPIQAQQLLRFFKTGVGEYGEGDQFLGIKVPVLRKIAKTYANLTLHEIRALLHTNIHEKRFLALAILINQYQRNVKKPEQIALFYLKHKRWINNWDLVDTSAPYILGHYLWDKPREVLYELAKSRVLWDRRIAILSTFYFIKQKDFDDTLQLATQFLNDDEDLMHKAVGWMLREIGKRHFKTAEQFIKQHHKTMPRTMLRYALEKFPDAKRKRYMKR